MRKIRIGVIGTSGWTEMMYLKPLSRHPGAEIAAVCGQNSERTAATAARYGVANKYTDWSEMIRSGKLDAVAIVTPDDIHATIAHAAVEAGLDLVCEKPLANTAADAWSMARAARRANRKTMVLFTWRWQPHFIRLKQILNSGLIGTPLRAELTFRGGFVLDNSYQWRLDPKRANGTISDLGSHMIDMGRWLFGDVASVFAQMKTMRDRRNIAGHEEGSLNDSATLLVRFSNGVDAVIDVSAATIVGDRHMDHRVRVEGEEGTIELDYVFRGVDSGMTFRMARGREPFHNIEVPSESYGKSDPTDGFDIYLSESTGVRYFVDCLLADRRPAPDFEDSAYVQDAIDAAILSDREGRRITLTPRGLMVPR
jgi:predicted dehydrogenase